MPRKMREMVGGCCVCSDESGWDENPLVYCDGPGCNVAVHQACYGIVTVPQGPWYCRKCESQERSARVRCELCPNKDGALKRTDTNSWAHVVCALYIPEVRFGNVATMEPIVLGLVPEDRYQKTCYICEQQGRESRASVGACMPCNKPGCKQTFHVTCAQAAGLLCEEAGNYMDNVRYCGYCEYHYQRINKKVVKTIPAFRPLPCAVENDTDEDAANASNSLSPSKSPKENPGSSTQGRNSSLSTSSTSSKKGKKGKRNHQGVSSSGASPKSDTEKPATVSTPASSPLGPTLVLKRSQSEDIPDPKKSADETTTSSKPEPLKISAEKLSDVSSSNSDPAEKKPPSVIVKFGKQDGTYYSKKQELPSSSSKKEKPNHKPSESSLTISTISITKREIKDCLGAISTKDINDKKSSPADTSTKYQKTRPDTSSSAEPNEVAVKEEPIEESSNQQTSKNSADSLSHRAETLPVDKTKVDLKIQEGKSMTSNNGGSPPNGHSKLTIGSKKDLSTTDRSQQDSAAKIIPLVTSTNQSKGISNMKRPADSGVADLAVRSTNDNGGSSPPRVNTELISPIDSKSSLAPKRTLTGKRLGRPPKKGTHLHSDSLGPLSLVGSSSMVDKNKNESVEVSQETISSDAKRRKQSPGARLSNGSDSSSLWMMGASLNPTSTVAKEMDACLKDEIQTHSVYDAASRPKLHGVPLPGALRKKNKSSSSQEQSAKASSSQHPQTLEELLERQWEQGSQFLMEQASHFDIASLLSSLHQLKEENFELEDSIDRLVQRRDHLLAVRARLMALSSLSSSPQNSNQATPERPSAQPHTNGPSPASGRSSTHASPRNSAATVSPIRVDRSGSVAATIISPRNLPPPSSVSAATIMSPRDRVPPPHHAHQPPSPRDRVAVENGIDFHSAGSTQHVSYISSASQIIQNRGHVFATSRGGNLLTVVSSANSGANLAHHRSLPPHHMSGPPPGGHSPHVQTPPPGMPVQPPPRQSTYPSMGGALPPPSHSSSRAMHLGHPAHSLPPPPPGGMMRPPMSHHQPYPSGYHGVPSPRVPSPHGPPPSHGGPMRSSPGMMSMGAHMRSSNVMDKR